MTATTKTEPPKMLWTLHEASPILGGISVRSLERAEQAGALKVVKIGRRKFINAGELERICRDGLKLS